MAHNRRDFLKTAAAFSAASYVGMNLPLNVSMVEAADAGVS